MRNLDLIYIRHNQNVYAPQINPHVIHFHELTILLKGTLTYTVDGETVPLSDGDAVYLPAGSLRARCEPEEPVDYVSFNFISDGEVILPRRMQNVLCSEILLLIAACDKIGSRIYPDSSEETVHLFACLLLVLEARARAERISPLTKQIMEYIHANLHRQITLADIGELTHYSPIYCTKVFKKEIGRSIMDYLLERRIDEAKKLLPDDTLSVVQVAEAVGFSDYNYFSRLFRKRSGCSPTVYRRFVQDRMQVR